MSFTKHRIPRINQFVHILICQFRTNFGTLKSLLDLMETNCHYMLDFTAPLYLLLVTGLYYSEFPSLTKPTLEIDW